MREGRVFYFSFPHRTQPTHDLSWGLTIRNCRLLGPLKLVHTSAVDDGLPLGDIKVPADYTKNLVSGRQHRLGTALPARFALSQGYWWGLGEEAHKFRGRVGR